MTSPLDLPGPTQPGPTQPGPILPGPNLSGPIWDISRIARAALKQQRPAVLWFTGLSGAGKSTIANLVDRRLYALGRHTAVLDGDNVRQGLNRDLGFTAADRAENIRRISEVAGLFAEAGLIVLVAFISPDMPSAKPPAPACRPANSSKCSSIPRLPIASRAT